MALTPAQVQAVAEQLGHKLFVLIGDTATSDATELKAAVQAVDDLMNANTNQLQGVYPGTVVKVAIRDHAKTGAPNLTNQQAAIVLAYWALNEVGLL